MKRILITGCGDIAMRVAPLLRNRYRLFGLVRRKERCAALRAAGITPLPGDLDDRNSLSRISGLADIVLHFAPPATKYTHIDLRTHNLLAVLSQSAPPKQLIYISTSGVYGDCCGVYVCETRPINPQTARAQLRADAEQQIRDWAKRNHVNASILRVPGIYATDRLPLEHLRAGRPAISPGDDSYVNHIHADDLARIAVAALRRAKPNRVYHACDDSPIKMGDYFDAVADAFGFRHPPRLPRAEVERDVSPMLWSFMSESRRLTNWRMQRELKVKLRYRAVLDAFA